MSRAELSRGAAESREFDGGLSRYLISYALGLAPALLMVLTWSPEGELSQFQRSLRSNGATVVGAQLFIIVIALREGILTSLPRWDWSRPVIAAVAVLVALSVATAFLAALQTEAIIVTAYWFIHGMFGLSIAYMCGRVFSAEDLIRAYLAGFAVVATLFVSFVYLIPDWGGFDWRLDLAGFNHVRHVGLYLAPVAALAVGVMAVAKHRIEWAWAFVATSLAVGLSLWTGSRGAVMAIVAAAAVSLLVTPAFRAPRGWGGALASLVLAAAVVSQIPAASHPMMGVTRTVESSVGGEVTTGRTEMWRRVVKAIERRPVFGHGEGQMRKVATFSDMTHPHNSILQVTLAWGIVGLVCVLVLAVAFARRAFPAVRRSDGYALPAFIGLVALAVLSLVDNPLINPIPGSMFAAFAGIIASRWKPDSRRPESSSGPLG